MRNVVFFVVVRILNRGIEFAPVPMKISACNRSTCGTCAGLVGVLFVNRRFTSSGLVKYVTEKSTWNVR